MDDNSSPSCSNVSSTNVTSQMGTTSTSSNNDTPPFVLLPGEGILIDNNIISQQTVGVCKWDKMHAGGLMYITNYRIFVLLGEHQGFYNVPLTSIDTVETRDLQSIIVSCKDGTVFRYVFNNSKLSQARLFVEYSPKTIKRVLCGTKNCYLLQHNNVHMTIIYSRFAFMHG